MEIRQFEDKALSHFSYAILSESAREIVLIDPARDIQPYLDYAEGKDARITGVIETHPHADFVSGHLELHRRAGATLYASALQQVEYPHSAFDEGAVLEIGEIRLKPINTPGHSPDSISVVLEQDGRDHAVFTGDTLFIGDCGRPDLRESTGNVTAKREELAAAMYHSLREKLAILPDEVLVYPAHGAGSLCGKALSAASESTIGDEKKGNWSLQPMAEADFIRELTADQPFVPKYFTYDVALNRRGADDLKPALSAVPRSGTTIPSDGSALLVDTRPEAAFKAGHLPGAINVQDGGKFETWLGSIVAPEETFYLLAADEDSLTRLIGRTAKIGYEAFVRGGIVTAGSTGLVSEDVFDHEAFRKDPAAYTIVDVRNRPEVKGLPVFEGAINIPLPELRERVGEVPTGKPIVVHCAAGYRSAAGSSILSAALNGDAQVFDLGEEIRSYQTKAAH